MANMTKFVKECTVLIRDILKLASSDDQYAAGYIDGLLMSMRLLGKPLSWSACIRPECDKRYLPRIGKKYCSESCRQLAYRSRRLSAGDHVIREHTK